MSSKEGVFTDEKLILDGDFYAGWNYPSIVRS
jgi:hypothetical protein